MHWITPSEKAAVTDALEKRLWPASNQFRANFGLESQEYTTVVLRVIFLRFAGQRAKRKNISSSLGRNSRLKQAAIKVMVAN